MLKKIWSSLPQLSLFIIILAIFKNFLYYFNFNVPIKYFIGLSELGLLVAGDLFMLVPMILLMYVISLENWESRSSKKLKSLSEEKKSNIQAVEVKKSKLKKVVNLILIIIVLCFLFFTMVVAPIYYLFQPISFGYKLIFGSFLLGEIAFALFISKYEILESIFTSNGMMLLLGFIVFVILFISQTAMEIESVETGQYKGTKIITSDSTYVSTDSAYYIGQTTNFVFFYSVKDKHTTILPSSEVKKLELYSK